MERPDDFPEDCWKAFQSVLSAVIKNTEDREAAETSNPEDCQRFVKFLKTRFTQTEETAYQEELDQEHISEAVLKNARTDGFPSCSHTKKEPMDRAFIAFELSAKHHQTTLLLHFARYAEDVQNRPIIGLQGYASVVTKLLKILSGSREAAKKSYAENVMSEQLFSEGLREGLLQYNDELNYLTIEQVRAIQKATEHRNLWVQGEAGTGKTIFAVEMAYRSLQASLSVLLVYRTSQFESIFSRLLSAARRKPNLLLYQDFLFLLRLLSVEGKDSEHFKSAVSELLPNLDNEQPIHFDLIIIDDCGTYDVDLPKLVSQAEQIADRKIFLAGPEQILDNIRYNFQAMSDFKVHQIDGIETQELTAPTNYKVAPLHMNIRNAKAIADYMHRHLKSQYSFNPGVAGIKQQGLMRIESTTWHHLDQAVLSICNYALKDFAPSSIKILVDPGLMIGPLYELPPEQYEEEFDAICSELPQLTRAILFVSRRSNFLHSTFACEVEQIEELKSITDTETPYFVYTDGEELGAVTDISLPESGTENTLGSELLMNRYRNNPHLDAKALLEKDVFADPIQIGNAISIYPVPLFIGLEAEFVIYIRNARELYAQQLADKPELLKQFKAARAAHHYLSMSRAKYALHEVLVA